MFKLVIISLFSLFGSINQNAWSDFQSAPIEQNEKEVLYYINLVRLEPIFFKDSILEPFLAERKNEYAKKYVRSLKKDLKKTANLSALKHHKELHDFSQHRAITTGKRGKVGHRSVWNKSYKKRSQELLKTFEVVGENIHYGSTDPLEVVIELLIDDGIADLGHRKNILDKSFNSISCAFAPHKKYRWNCVIGFGKLP